MIVVSKNVRYMRIFAERGHKKQYMIVTVYLRPNSMCLCEIIPCVLLTYRVYRVGVHCPSVRRALTAPDCTRECLSRAVTRVRSRSYLLRVLLIVTIRVHWR